MLDRHEIDLDWRLIELALGVPVLEWAVLDVSRNLGSFMLDVVVDQSSVPEAELPVASGHA